jgi:hypothetical protein
MTEYQYSKVLDVRFKQFKEYLVNRYNLSCIKFGNHKFGEQYILKLSNEDKNIKGHGHPSVWMFVETTSHIAENTKYAKFGMEILLKGKLNENNRGRIKPLEESNKNFSYQFHHFLNYEVGNDEVPYIRIDLYNKELESFSITEEDFFLNILDVAFNSYINELRLNDYIERENAFSNLKDSIIEPSETEREVLVKVRTKQGFFKDALLKTLEITHCKICGLNFRELLIASHIKSWSESKDYERIDPFNGFLLCTIHDAIFDKKLISFNEEGEIMISKILNQLELLNIKKDLKIDLHEKNLKYLKEHRKHFEILEKER